MKTLVFGAAGHIGKHVCVKLAEAGTEVVALVKSSTQLITFEQHILVSYYDVTTRQRGIDPVTTSPVGAIIYCVGHCPKGGFLSAISLPLSQFPADELAMELAMHVAGPLNVFQEFLPVMNDGGCFLFMSSAATRLLSVPREARPPIQIYHHLAAIAAEDALIEGMRMDPEVKRRGIKVHRIMPPAIRDSPFHEVSNGPKLPVTVTTAQVVDAIVSSGLPAQDHANITMVP